MKIKLVKEDIGCFFEGLAILLAGGLAGWLTNIWLNHTHIVKWANITISVVVGIVAMVIVVVAIFWFTPPIEPDYDQDW